MSNAEAHFEVHTFSFSSRLNQQEILRCYFYRKKKIVAKLFPGKSNLTCWRESNISRNDEKKWNLLQRKTWGSGSLHLVPKPSIHCRAMNVTIISSKIPSAIKRKLQELGADGDEKRPDYIMVMVAEKSQDDKGLPTWRNNLVLFSVFPDVCHTDQHESMMSEKSSWCDWGEGQVDLHHVEGPSLERWVAWTWILISHLLAMRPEKIT